MEDYSLMLKGCSLKNRHNFCCIWDFQSISNEFRGSSNPRKNSSLQSRGLCSLFGFRKYLNFFLFFSFSIWHFFFWHILLALPLWRTSWKADYIVVIQKCFCLASSSCFKPRTNDRAKHPMWKCPVIKLMKEFFF